MAFTMKTAICFSLAVLAVTFFAPTTAGGNQLCAGADDKALCSQLSGGAKTWAAAMTAALNNVLSKAKAGKNIADVIGSKLPRNLKPQTKQSIISTCREAHENMIDNLQQCLGFVKKDPDGSLSTYLSAVSFSDCTDGLDEFEISVPEATHFGDQVLKQVSTLLALAEKK